MKVIFLLVLLSLTGCSGHVSMLERSGMTEAQVKNFNALAHRDQKRDAAQDQVIASLIKSLGEVRQKLGMNEESK